MILLCFCFLTQNATAQCSITTSTNTSTLTCGVVPLRACNGVLYIGDGTTVMNLNLNADLDLTCLGPIQMIVRDKASLDFHSGNDYLTLAAGSSITFLPGSGLIGGSCNASERIYIGSNLLASCNGNAGADLSFANLLTIGGTGSLASNSPICVGSSINLTATPPPNGTFTYSFSGPGLPATTYSSSPNYSVVATTNGTYTVKIKSSLIANPSIAEVAVTVIALPTKPTVGTITSPTCSLATGSVALSALPASGTWTLTQSGTSSATTTGTGTTTTVSGLPLGTYTFQVSNGTCTSLASASVVITPVSSSIWNGSSWSNGIPTSTTNIVFNGNYSVNSNLTGCSCQVTSGSVMIAAGYCLKLDKAITVLGGSLTIDENASLVQVDDSALNSGAITAKRSATIKKFDYVYWSSPVANFPIISVSPSTLTAHLWKWIPTVGGNYGTWNNANENMIIGKGYIIRGPSTFDNITPQKFTANFSGTPNNGIITSNIERGGYQGIDYIANGVTVSNKDDNFNLIGNPYPSSIKALDFLTYNTNIEGAVRLWTHGTLPSTSAPNPFYGSFVYNYTMNDYIVYNGTGTISGPIGFNGYIASGQGFFVTMTDGNATTETVTFKNSMRSNTYNNSQFYRASNIISENQTRNEGRIWLDLLAANGAVNRTLIGYKQGATNNKDRMYDATIKLNNGQNFYSLTDGQKVCIQGRSLPFTTNDRVALGYQLPTTGTYTIALAAVDGLFEDEYEAIYLRDQLLNITHDLKQAPYTFSSESGVFDNRFIMFYSSVDVRNSNFFEANPQNIIASVNRDNSLIKIVSSTEKTIKDIRIYDLLGRVLYTVENINNTSFDVTGLVPTNQILIINIGLSDGQTITKKVSY